MSHYRGRAFPGCAGFTMVELIVTIGILGILAAILGPRFFSRSAFEARGFFDQATQTVRYAQKTSVAWRRQVFVCISADTITAGLAAGCPAPLTNPATGATLTVTAPAGLVLAGASFSFTAPSLAQAGGQPSTGAQVVIALNSTNPAIPSRQIVIERETGYVHN